MSLRARRESARRISDCVTALLRDQPIFGSLALRLPIRADAGREMLASDGREIRYSPEWVADTDADLIKTAIGRMVLACALKHHTRRGERDPERWQRASQLVIHGLLCDTGFKLPPEAEAWDGISVEQAYDRLPEPQDGEGGEDTSPPSSAGDDDSDTPDPQGAGCRRGDDPQRPHEHPRLAHIAAPPHDRRRAQRLQLVAPQPALHRLGPLSPLDPFRGHRLQHGETTWTHAPISSRSWRCSPPRAPSWRIPHAGAPTPRHWTPTISSARGGRVTPRAGARSAPLIAQARTPVQRRPTWLLNEGARKVSKGGFATAYVLNVSAGHAATVAMLDHARDAAPKPPSPSAVDVLGTARTLIAHPGRWTRRAVARNALGRAAHIIVGVWEKPSGEARSNCCGGRMGLH